MTVGPKPERPCPKIYRDFGGALLLILEEQDKVNARIRSLRNRKPTILERIGRVVFRDKD